MKEHTYDEIANSCNLWMEYVDPSGVDSECDFNAMSHDEKIKVMKECFGNESK